MPTWGEILAEVNASAQQRAPLGLGADYDGIRRRYLTQLHALTGRGTILYTTNWLRGATPPTSITLEDMQGMMEVCHGLTGPNLDLIIHSPGGSAEATASIVRYLRRQFLDIRVFVPLAAMSAATMWALSGNLVVMGKHSQLGPIDPQLIMGQMQVPTRALIREFERAKEEIASNPGVLGAWLPRLQQYPPAVLEQCEAAEELSKRLTMEWLREYMFRGEPDAPEKAKRVADYFANYATHQSHSLGIDRDQARAVGVSVMNLEDDQRLQDAMLSVHHAALLTFAAGPFKIIENHQGRAFVQSTQVAQIMLQGPVQPGLIPPGFLPPAMQPPQPPTPPAAAG
jgi:hypothetical protein